MSEQRKRYLLFAFDWYYPAGGWSDLVSSHETLDEAIEAGKALVSPSLGFSARSHYEIVDIERLEVVAHKELTAA